MCATNNEAVKIPHLPVRCFFFKRLWPRRVLPKRQQLWLPKDILKVTRMGRQKQLSLCSCHSSGLQHWEWSTECLVKSEWLYEYKVWLCIDYWGSPQLNRDKGAFLSNYTKAYLPLSYTTQCTYTRLYQQSPGLLLTCTCLQQASINLCMILARASEQLHFMAKASWLRPQTSLSTESLTERHIFCAHSP